MIGLPDVAAPVPVGAQSSPPGNPDQLRASGRAFGAAAAALAAQAAWVRRCGTVDGWVGATASAYQARMAGIAQRMDQAGQAMQHAAAALGELADRLEEAQLLWARASGIVHPSALSGLPCPSGDDFGRATRLFATARAEGDGAGRVARDRLAGVTAALYALRAQAKAPLPRPPAGAAAINPCGAFPQQASSVFWNNGIIPLDTVCIVYAATLVEVDGEPVSVLEPVPLIGSGTTDTKGKPKRNQVDPENDEAIPAEVKSLVQARIRRAQAVGDEGIRFQADTAQNLRVRGVRVIGFGNKVFDKFGKTITDIDIETDHALIEVTTSPSGKFDQSLALLKDPRVNPAGKPVAVFGLKYSPTAAIKLTSEDVEVFTSEDDLASWLLGLQR